MSNAIILAAGRGSRLKGFTVDRPKCLNVANGKPLLEWQMRSLQAAGISQIAAATGYKKEMIEAYPLTTAFNADWASTNMVFSLYRAAKLAKAGTIISYSDILYSPAAIKQLKDAPGTALVVLFDRQWRALWESRSEDPLSDTENFQLGENGRVLKIGGKAKSMDEPAGQYMGLIRLSAAFLEWFAALGQKDEAYLRSTDMTSLLQRYINEGGEVTGTPTEGNWMEVDTEADLHLAEKMIAAGQLDLFR